MLLVFLCVDGLLLASSSLGTETTAGISVLFDIRTSDGARRTLNMSVLLTLFVCCRRSIRWNLSVSVLGV